MTTRFHHVGLNVADLPMMQTWYCQAFDLEPVLEFSIDVVEVSIAMLTSRDGFFLELLCRMGNEEGLQAADPVEAILTRGYGHIAFDVDDVDRVYDGLLRAGASERLSPRPSPEPGVSMAFVADPEGNLIELLDRSTINADHQRRREMGL